MEERAVEGDVDIFVDDEEGKIEGNEEFVFFFSFILCIGVIGE